MMADDNEANLELLSGMFSAAGYLVVCGNGPRAMATFRAGSADLVIVCVVTPGQTVFLRMPANRVKS
jgi:CheY-like chemotaxis protein